MKTGKVVVFAVVTGLVISGFFSAPIVFGQKNDEETEVAEESVTEEETEEFDADQGWEMAQEILSQRQVEEIEEPAAEDLLTLQEAMDAAINKDVDCTIYRTDLAKQSVVSDEAQLGLAERTLVAQEAKVKEETVIDYLAVVSLKAKVEEEEEELSDDYDSLESLALAVRLGDSVQAELDSLTETIAYREETMEDDQKKLDEAWETLSDITGFELDNSWYLDSVDRIMDFDGEWADRLEEITAYAIDWDPTCYQVRMELQENSQDVWTLYNEQLEQYGSKIAVLSSYIDAADAGEQIDIEAYKQDYEQVVQVIEKADAAAERKAERQAKKEAERLAKQETEQETEQEETDSESEVEEEEQTQSGAVETDAAQANEEELEQEEEESKDLYELYDAILGYLTKTLELEDLEEKLTKNIEKSYAALVEDKEACVPDEEAMQEEEKDAVVKMIDYRLGKITKEEYTAYLENTEETDNSMWEEKISYIQDVYAFNTLTCEGATMQDLSDYVNMENKEVG